MARFLCFMQDPLCKEQPHPQLRWVFPHLLICNLDDLPQTCPEAYLSDLHKFWVVDD